MNFHVGLHDECKDLKKFLGEQLVSSFIFLDYVLNIFLAPMAFVIILASFYVFLCAADILKMLERPISDVSSI